MLSLTDDTITRLFAADDAAAERRRQAYRLFTATPMPNPKDEHWRYVDLDLDLDRFRLADQPGDLLPDDDVLTAVDERAGRAVVQDGSVVAVESDGPAVVESIRSLLSRGAPVLDLVEGGVDKFAAAHAAFGTDGLTVEVPAGVSFDRPLLVDVQTTVPGSISFPSVSVTVGDDADASLVVVLRSPDDLEAVIVPNLSLDVGDAARLRITVVQELGNAITSIAHQRVRVGRDATARLGEVGLGGRFARLDLGATLEGAGGSVEFVGLSFGEHSQVLDYRMVIDHVGRNTSSDVFLKGAVEDEAQSVFTGLLRIEKNAVRSSAFETNRNLVLSPGAKANSVPNLEILCDDVVCGHGSSVGPLEEEPLYYLQSRGMSRQRAERLLVRGFFSEVVDRLPNPRLAAPIKAAVYRRFEEAQAEGRLS